MEDSKAIAVDAANGSGNSKAAEKRACFLVVEAQGELYAVRWVAVREAIVLFPGEVNFSVVPPEIERNGISFPLHYLWQLVGLKPGNEQADEIAAVFLEENDRRMVLVPDRILWRQEAAFKELPDWLSKSSIVSGAVALESGVAVVVIEPLAVLSSRGGTVDRVTEL